MKTLSNFILLVFPKLKKRNNIIIIKTLINQIIGLKYFLLLKLFFTKKKHDSNKPNKNIVFVSEQPFRREAKLAFALKSNGWAVSLIYKEAVIENFSDFSKVYRVKSSWEALYIANKLNTGLFHVFSNTSDDLSLCFALNKPGILIFDFYDYFWAKTYGFQEESREFAIDIKRQKICFDNADAICSRDLQIQFKRTQTNIGRGIPTICFPIYCWNNLSIPLKQSSNEIHIVQIGWMGFETRGEEDIGSFHVVRKFVDAGCHFHIYIYPGLPSIGTSDFVSLYRDYLSLGEITGRVHFHQNVPTHLIPGEISKYDFGFNMTNASNFNIPRKRDSNDWLRLCGGSSRQFDYLDAGLNLLVDDNLRFTRHIFSKYGILVNGTRALDSGNIIKYLDNRATSKQILKARDVLSTKNNISRLINFYEHLL